LRREVGTEAVHLVNKSVDTVQQQNWYKSNAY